MTNITSNDIEFIRDWMAKEDHLPKDFTDMMIKKFLHSCYGSLEQTKQCIEKFCAGRLNMTEMYTNRDPLSPKAKTALSIINLVTYNAGEDELLIFQDDPTLECYDFYEATKTFALLTDNWIKSHPVYPKGHIFLLDLQKYILKAIPKINVFHLRQVLRYLLEAMPIRLKEIHAYNCPSYYEKLYLLVKPVLPPEIINLIHFHATIEGVHKTIDKKYLPTELGGDAPSMKEQMAYWVNNIEESRAFFLDENLWKGTPSKKSKAIENTMNGSFRTLSID